jgi:hypothetical protein
MPATKIALQFRGYWRDINVAYIPPISGIYCVYSCFNNAWNNMLTLNELFYIGLANDGRQRLAKHERKQDWIERLRPGEELCYNFAPIMWPNRERAEAAMIHEHHPWANDEYVTNFPFDRTTIVVSGDCLRLRMVFTLDRFEMGGYEAALRQSRRDPVCAYGYDAKSPTPVPSYSSYENPYQISPLLDALCPAYGNAAKSPTCAIVYVLRKPLSDITPIGCPLRLR